MAHTEWDEVVVLLGSDPIAFEPGGAGEWDYYLILQDGRRVGYSGPRPPVPRLRTPAEREQFVLEVLEEFSTRGQWQKMLAKMKAKEFLK